MAAFDFSFDSSFDSGSAGGIVGVGAGSLLLDVAMIPAALISGAESVAEGRGSRSGVWKLIVTVSGIDVTDQVFGDVSVDAEEGAARIADLTLRPPAGTVLAAAAWTGRSVTIEIDAADGGLAMPLFTGVVDTLQVDLAARTLALRCTDGLQHAVNALDKTAIGALIGGYWSPVVFERAAVGWAHARDRLATVTASLDRSPTGALRLTPWAAKPVADLALTGNRLLEGSLQVEPADLAGLVNTVEIRFGYRFPRLMADTYGVAYSYVGPGTFASYVNGGGFFLQREQVKAAISAAGGAVVGILSFEPLPTTGVDLGLGGFWTPGPADDQLCQGFTASVAFDFARLTEEIHVVTVYNEAAVLANGRQMDRLSGALDGVYPEPESAEAKIGAFRTGKITIPPPDKATPVVGLRTTAEPTLTSDTDRAAANRAIETLIALAKTMIWASHRRNRVSFAVPLNPAVDLDKTLAVNCAGVVAKGKVVKVVHRLEAEREALAVTEVELAICSVAGVGFPHQDDAATYTAASSEAPASLAVVPVVTFNGGASEDHSLTIVFPGVESAERAKSTVSLASSVRAGFPEDHFMVTL